MKPIVFRQINRTVGLLAALIYLTIAFGLLFGIVGIGKVASFVNSIGDSSGGTKALGLVAGLVFVIPVFFIARLVYPKLEVHIEGGSLLINKGGSPFKNISIQSIASMALNKPKINTLNLYGEDGELIYCFQPFNNNSALSAIVKGINAVKKFRIKEGQKSVFGAHVSTTEYIQ